MKEPPTDSFAAFNAAVRSGDEDGARRLYDRYYGALVRQAAERIGKRLQVRVDPEDLAQSCLKSFVGRAAGGQFEFDHWADVWATLIGIIANKSNNAARFHGRAKRSIHIESDGQAGEAYQPDTEPTPADHAEMAETLDLLLARFPDDDRRVVELSLLGHTPTEIADQLNRAIRGVHRVRSNVRTYLESQLVG